MNKKLFLLPVAVAGMSLVACGGGKTPEPEPTDLTVNLVSKSLDISYSSITKDNDFVATISLKGEYESKYNLPISLGYIQVEGSEDISYLDYTYEPEPNASSALLIIPGKFVTNNLTITSEAKLVKYSVAFVQSLAFKTETTSVGKNESLDMVFYLDEDYEPYVDFPDFLNIYIGDSTKPLDEEQYYYVLANNGVRKEARLRINSKYINGDINITSVAEPAEKKAFITDTNNALKLENDTVIVGMPFTTRIYSTDEDWSLPRTLTKVEYQDGDGTVPIPDTDYTYDSKTGNLSISGAKIFGDLTITADSIELHYLRHDSSVGPDKVSFYKQDGTTPLENPEEIFYSDIDANGYKFVVTTEPGGDYDVPPRFSITCDGITIPENAYTVEYQTTPTESKQTATVTIKKEVMHGDIFVSGKGVPKELLQVTPALLYVSSPDMPTAVNRDGGEINCTINCDSKYEQPDATNVNVRITYEDGVSTKDIWYDGNGYSDIPGANPVDIKYDVNQHTLHIGNSVISKAHDTSEIVIAAKPHDVSVLRELTTSTPDKPADWSTLHKFSKYGPGLFDLGEETAPFSLDYYDYQFKARIIGFDHERDQTDTGVIDGLTLEFTSCINTSQYYQTTVKENGYYYKDFTTSTTFQSKPYKFLNDTYDGIYTVLPKTLRESIVPVCKKTLRGGTNKSTDLKNSTNYLFPLSLVEMNEAAYKSEDSDFQQYYSKEGSVYAYYAQFDTETETSLQSVRVKSFQTSSNYSYWLRSPNFNKPTEDWSISSHSRAGDAASASQTTLGIAPAFCI